MQEICGDVGPENQLSKGKKAQYLAGNFLRGIQEWSLPGKVKAFQGTVSARGSESPGRLYVDAFLKHELPKRMLPGNIRVLDIGCGTGYVQTILSELGYTGEYVGLDIQREEGFGAHTDAFAVSFVELPIEEYHPEEKFDLVLSNTTFEHIQDDRKAALVAFKVLKDDGVGVHIVPSFWSLFLYLFHGYRQYTPKMLRRAFAGQKPVLIGLGGLGSFLVHLLLITVPERVFGAKSVRHSRLYEKAVAFGLWLDRVVPVCRALYGVVVTPEKDARTKVLFALPSLLVGGIEQQLTEQLARYDRSKFSFAVVTLFEYEGREDFKNKLPEDVTFQSIGMRGAFDMSGWRRLASFLASWKPQMVVSSMFSANTALRLLAPFFRYAVIAREHNLYEEKTTIQRLVDRMLAPFSCRIVAVSKGVARFASRQAGIRKERFAVIQNGVDVKKLRGWHETRKNKQQVKLAIGIALDEKLIVTVGRLKKAKNHEALIRGFAEFSKTHSEYRLIIIGSGVERPALQALVELIPHERVVLLERYGEAVWPYYAAADWFILPSLREGFPNVMLEAMAFGLPLLGTEIAGTEECIEDGVNGYYIPVTASGITGALRRAAKGTEEKRDSMGNASFERVQKFSIEETVRKYEELFTTCSN